MQRKCMTFLVEWLNSEDRLPLVIRGARQVGKTWLVRHLAESQKKELFEINLEFEPEHISLFSKNDPRIVIQKIEEAFHRKVDPQKSILFIDEIQARPNIFAKLRWFAEMMPELPVIAAGSLLEFVLGKHQMSMPVGRIEYMYVEPLSFEEFLLAQQKSGFLRTIHRYNWGDEISRYTHDELTRLFNEYIIIGGMPAVVKKWVKTKSLVEVGKVHRSIFTTYRDDFKKYGTRISPDLIDKTLMRIPKNLGRKFVYSEVDRTVQVPAIKKSLKLLSQARVCTVVLSTDANGVPLTNENEKYLKAILLDVGLCSVALNLSLKELESYDDLILINKGGIAEQVTGQLLRTVNDCSHDTQLFYWLRHAEGSSAEVDYIVQHGTIPVPLEVKSGMAGALKSLHLFMSKRKNLSKAVRVYSGLPLITQINVKSEDEPIKYELRSIPFYLLGEIHRLLR